MTNYALLIAEDDQIALETFVKLLKSSFPKIYTAQNGKEALQLYKEKNIDIVITDITMPIMDGIELITQIRALDNNIPIAILSARSEPDYFIKSIDLDVDGYIPKPINIKKAIQLINRFIQRLDQTQLQIKNTQLMQQYKEIIDENTIVSKSDVNGTITYVNEAMAKLTEYSIEELIGSNHNIIRHPDTPKELFEEMWDTILAKKIWKGKVKNQKKSGEHYWVDVIINPILDEFGNIIEFIAVRKDITLEVEYKIALEKQVQEQVDKLRKQDQLMLLKSKQAAMGEIVDAIAHQWKQPLNTINLKSDFLVVMHKKDKFIPYEEVVACRDTVKKIVYHLIDTLNEFRDFLRPNKKTDKFALSGTINSALVLLKDDLLGESISINIDIKNEIIIDGIENEFKHVLINLISNAKDAFIQNNSTNRKIDIITLVEDGKQRLIFKDNAGGIPKDIIENIFDSHVTSKAEGEGTGIGLYMSKQILDKHEALIDVSNKDNGACFIINFQN